MTDSPGPAAQPALRVRPLTASDEPDWRRLWTGYLEFYESSVSDEVYDTTFRRLLDPARDNQHGLIAVDDSGAAVGLVHYIVHPHNWRVEDVVYLQDLFVDPLRRGERIGRALIEAVYAAADQRGTPSVYWLTQDFNDTGRRLYDRVAQLTPFIKYQR